MPTNNDANRDMDVLVLAPFGKDASLIESILRQSGFEVRTAPSIREIVAGMSEGAGVAILSEEALQADAIPQIARQLAVQPPWSDFPIVVLTGGGLSTAATEVAVRSRAPLGNVSLLERPLRAATMISAVRSSLAARRRQYEIRDHLRERKLAEDALRRAHDTLESVVEERTAALRQLSAQLLRVQDDERRRIARELHDSLGQYLAAAKINLDLLALKHGDGDRSFADARQLIDRAITETRTLSYLLHPPLLDAAGFASAANWYVEGFGQRSGIKSTLKMPQALRRLPIAVETALFRIMQEALTNVHRHSGTDRVEITLTTDESNATLKVQDFGRGIPRDLLDRFQHSGTNVGVGLAGIRERIKELGGTLEIHSDPGGTVLIANIPMAENRGNTLDVGSRSQIYSSLAS